MIGRRIQYELAGKVVGPAMLSVDNLRSRARRALKPKKKGASPFGPPLESGRKLKDMMSLHYLEGRYADGAVPVAWVTSGFPVELLRPFGYHVVYPENHGALCSARRMVPELATVAEEVGYSRDICGYARADIGSVMSGQTPVGRLPKPDVLFCCTNICQTVMYWYRSLAAQLDVPLLVLDTPYVYGEASEAHLDYVEAQLSEVVDLAARVARRSFEPEALAAVMALAHEGSELWGRCLATAQQRPAPWTGFDGFIHMAPIVAMRGTAACNAYYRMLLDELEDRVKRGIAGVQNEQHRLLWDNLPIWYRIRDLSTTFAEAGFNFVCTTYTNAWAETATEMDPADPMRSMARAYTKIILNRDLNNRLRIMRGLARDYGCDGAVLHSDRSCKPYSVGQIDLKERLSQDGLRVMLLDADHADPRSFSEEQADNRMHAYIEGFAA